MPNPAIGMVRRYYTRALELRGALTNILAVTGLSVTASCIGFVLQILLAAHYGAGLPIDSYLFATSVPLFLAALGSAALSYSVVPALVEVELDAAARSTLLRHLRRRMVLIALVFVTVGIPALWLQPLSIPKNSALRDAPMLPILIGLGWSIGGVQIFTALFSIELNAARRPITAACLALPPNFVAILAVLLGPHQITTVPIGVLCGTLVSLVTGGGLTRRAFAGKDVKVHPARPKMHIIRIGWTLLAMSCFSIYSVIDAFWGPRAGVGTLASLGYAQRLVVGIGSLVVAGPSAVLTPRFAMRLRDGGRVAFLGEVRRTMLVIGVITSCAATLLMLLSSRLIEAAFGRGEFVKSDIIRVELIFRAMLPGFCAMLVSVVLTRAIFCLKDVERPMALASFSWAIVYFICCGAMLAWGGLGFGISYSLAWVIYLMIAIGVLHRYAPPDVRKQQNNTI